MPRKKRVIPEYGTCMRKGIEYYRTRIVDADGKRVSLYARTPEDLYEKVQEAERLIADASFRRSNPTVKEYCEKWLMIQKGRLRTTTYTDYEWKVKKYILKPLGILGNQADTLPTCWETVIVLTALSLFIVGLHLKCANS